MKQLGFALIISFYVTTLFAASETIFIGSPGGPAPALKECVRDFNKTHKKTIIEVTSGPLESWQDQASDFELLFSGSENMMDDFVQKFSFLDPESIETHYLRPAALLVRKGNPLKIEGIQDLITKDINVLVVNGAGQVGMWEDIIGRARSTDALNKFRKNIKFAAKNTGEAEKKWNEDKNIQAWVVFNIWGNRATNESEIVKIEDDYAIFRSMGSIKNKNSKNGKLRDEFLRFLKSKTCRLIFFNHGWQ